MGRARLTPNPNPNPNPNPYPNPNPNPNPHPHQVFSRNSEETTSKYPDIVAMLPKAMAPGVKSFILDAEAVAYDRVKKTIMPFQVLPLTLTPTPTLAIMPFQVLPEL